MAYGSALRTKFTADDFMGASTPEGSVIPANISGNYLAPSKRAQDAAAGIVSPLAQAPAPAPSPMDSIPANQNQLPSLIEQATRDPRASPARPVFNPNVMGAQPGSVLPEGQQLVPSGERNLFQSPLQPMPPAPPSQPLQTSQIPGDWDGMNNMQLAQAGAVDNAAERLTGRERQLRELEDAAVSGQPLPASPAETYQAPKKPPPSFLERFFKKEPKKQPLQTAYNMNPTAGIRG